MWRPCFIKLVALFVLSEYEAQLMSSEPRIILPRRPLSLEIILWDSGHDIFTHRFSTIIASIMETGFEKLFVKRGHPTENVIDGETSYRLTMLVQCNWIIIKLDLF